MENKNKIEKFNKENEYLLPNLEPADLESKLDYLVKHGEFNTSKLEEISSDVHRGFIGLFQQNQKLLESNNKLRKQLNEVMEELSAIKAERQKKASRKVARANRKRLPAREPMTAEIYQKVIQEVKGTTYVQIRLRLAVCLLAVTGVRVNELLNIKVGQLTTLLDEKSISIDRSKGGPIGHQSFLTNEGKKLMMDRKEDCQYISLIKEPSDFVFTPQLNNTKIIRREMITKDINKILKEVSKKLPNQPNLTTHSFRIGYITKLWQDSKDIEFVRQVIGHRKIDTTSMYVKALSNEERKKRIEKLK